jgi:hypothetical protein
MKTRMQRISLAVLVAGACGIAQAATTNLGPLSTTVPTAFTGAVVPAGPFVDTFQFILPANLGSAYSVIDFPVSGPGFDFSTLLTTLSLFSDPDGNPFTPDDQLVASSLAPGGSSLSLVFNSSDPDFNSAGGNYYINVIGTANGTTGGLYSGAISVTPIPEPEVWAMMLVGMGLVGFRLRNRSKRASAARFA